MSLQFIIDGYNVINHPGFNRLSNKHTPDKRVEFISLIKKNNLCGSSNNKAIVIFDGHSVDLEGYDFSPVAKVIFSRNESADQRIKRIVEDSLNPKNIVVVTDDKEIVYFCKSLKAKVMPVADFLISETAAKNAKPDSSGQDLSYQQVAEINNELKKL